MYSEEETKERNQEMADNVYKLGLLIRKVHSELATPEEKLTCQLEIEKLKAHLTSTNLAA